MTNDRGRLGVDADVVRLDGTSGQPAHVLGNKAFGINAMRRRGLAVPPAFCLTTNVCGRWFDDPVTTLDALWSTVCQSVAWLEAETGRAFGAAETGRAFGAGPRALLVSVRSGAAQSMPGMLDTVLNLGINDHVEDALAQEFSPSFARDTHWRFQRMYRDIVLDDDHGAVPDDPQEQLRTAIEAVFRSWTSQRAVAYRAHHGLDDLAGTAVVVQAMVFGNKDGDSGTGVLFSRDPRTGADTPFGEWLAGGQGEDVVSGTAEVQPISALAARIPAVYAELIDAAVTLEKASGDVQDIEFTVEEGKLWLLQTRTAKRSAQAALRLALALRREGLIDDAEALRRVTADHVRTLLLPALQPETRLSAALLASGLAACPGVVSGRAYTDVDDAIDAAEQDEDVILVRTATSPDDVQGMLAARGIVTEIGGATSHAAVVSRELGRPAVVGCGIGVSERLAGKLITVDGTEGEIRKGVLELAAWSEHDSPDLAELTGIALRHSPLRAHSSGNYPTVSQASEVAVREAISAGHCDVVSPTPLITMLTAIHLDQRSDGRTS
ncbi:pyruvate, phosphate dikinase [Mycobacterium arosiense]|uniref:Pyruvate, phosphate dikinase n=1 Tax=Mycobacterium arosiense ATCC BAA-1401 = DSM 45069 TaxID=1265311 RepID=A0A1W9ZQR5_MYCAI|nr:pyruvate, phosphate dikinase [Mycobacterium arosiense]ORA19965.1 pyruvate, phosphate dikinase [Mycobacterium arosiense ATCC BAA-1401 = DSM 45069]